MYIRETFYGMIERRRAITCGCAIRTASPCDQCRKEAAERVKVKRTIRLQLPRDMWHLVR